MNKFEHTCGVAVGVHLGPWEAFLCGEGEGTGVRIGEGAQNH